MSKAAASLASDASMQLMRPRKVVPENDIQSFMGQENWRQRIRKENAHAPKSVQFSVRNACRTLDVPKKPCQVQDPSGAAIQSAPSMEFRSFARSYAPNEQFLWPETATHDVGWLVKDSVEGERAIPVNQRSTILGPSQLGFGWRRRSAEKRQECCESVLPRQPATPSTAPGSSRLSASRAGRFQSEDAVWSAVAVPSPAEKALPWFPGIGKLRKQRRLQRKAKIVNLEASPHLYGAAEILTLRERPVVASDVVARGRPVSPVSPPPAESEQRPQTALPGNSAGLRVFLAQPVEDQWLRATSREAKLKPSTADHQLISSRSATCREFLRHGARSQWEREKPVSTMSSFAHGYTMLWGVNFFSRRGSQRP